MPDENDACTRATVAAMAEVSSICGDQEMDAVQLQSGAFQIVPKSEADNHRNATPPTIPADSVEERVRDSDLLRGAIAGMLEQTAALNASNDVTREGAKRLLEDFMDTTIEGKITDRTLTLLRDAA